MDLQLWWWDRSNCELMYSIPGNKNIGGSDAFLNSENFSGFFLRRHGPLVYFIYQIVSDQEAAEDLAEDCFVVVWERRGLFPNEKTASAYLYTTARNSSINWLRSKKNADKRSIEISHISPEPDTNILQSIIKAEFAAELWDCVKSLPPKCRKVFYLAYRDGLENKEIARVLRLSINTVKAQKLRGVKLLRKRISFFLTLIAAFFL